MSIVYDFLYVHGNSAILFTLSKFQIMRLNSNSSQTTNCDIKELIRKVIPTYLSEIRAVNLCGKCRPSLISKRKH